jgi:transposase
MAAWIGLVPKQLSTGNHTILGHITKRGDKLLRRLLYLSARNLLMRYQAGTAAIPPEVAGLLLRKRFKLVCIALANRMVRVAWAMLTKGTEYENPRLVMRAARA